MDENHLESRRGSSGYGPSRRGFNAFAASLWALWAIPAAAQTPPRLLVLGDSLSAGYNIQAREAFPVRLEAALRAAGVDVQVVNAGVSGDTSAGGLARVDWALGQRPPEFALVALGANDGLRGLDVDAMERNLDRILERMKARGVKPMLAGMLAPPNMGTEYRDRFAAVFPRLAAKHGVPLYPFLLEGVAARPEFNLSDGIHPNGQGVDTMVANILPHVRRFLAGG
ncbi:MAG: arylesterase [Azospirillum sp.]|nr:arylesterase [Azospirillum sp.]